MPEKVGSSISGNAGRVPERAGIRMKQSLMSEKQLQAYLAARDVVRRIKRTAEFFAPASCPVALRRFPEGRANP